MNFDFENCPTPASKALHYITLYEIIGLAFMSSVLATLHARRHLLQEHLQ
jgi:hypothetical protein